jgi:hypothetical protein
MQKMQDGHDTRFGLTYAQARLRLGILGVGLWVLASVAVLAWPGSHPLSAPQALIGYLALSLPLDLLGGQILPRLWRRKSVLSFRTWTGLYARALALHTTLLVLGLLGLSLGFRLLGTGLAVALYLGGALLLLRNQVRALLFVGAHSRKDEGVRWLRTSDTRFSGGLSGLPWREEIVLPAHWLDAPGASGWRLHKERHRLLRRSGARAAGALLGIGFNAAGLCWLLPATTGRVVDLACAMTLWSFLGLLVLPSLSRPGVHYADTLTVRCSENLADTIAWLAYLENLQEEDAERPVWVERIFHPIPSWNRRRTLPTSLLFPWNAARTALWTSSLTGGLLSRAVHCNSGRPELWFWPPND